MFEEEEPVFARPIKTSFPVNTVLSDSFNGKRGYHQNHNSRWRREALSEPPTDQPELPRTEPTTDS